MEVLSYISKDGSELAKTEFFSRYEGFLLQICRLRCSNFDDGEQLAEDIFQNTMIKAFKGVASLYNRLPTGGNDVKKIIKSWLAVIARNELREFLRNNPDEKRLADPFRIKSDSVEVGYDPLEEEELPSEVQTIEKQKLDSGLASLTDRERHVLMVYMEYYDPQNPNQHLPDNVIAELCNKYNTNSTNLRQIKNRAIKKLMIASK